jgi:hypothetical protein
MSPRDPADAPKSQRERFIEAARALGCDEDEAAFERTVRKVAKATLIAPASAKGQRRPVDRKPFSE